MENDQDDPDEINLELLGEEMDRGEDSLEQSDDDPGERSDRENTDNLIGELIFFPFSSLFLSMPLSPFTYLLTCLRRKNVLKVISVQHVVTSPRLTLLSL